MNLMESLNKKIKDMKENGSEINPFIPISVNDGRILIVSEMTDESYLGMDEFENGDVLENPNRTVNNVFMKDIETYYNSDELKDEKGIFLIHCDNIETDFRKLTPMIFGSTLVVVVLNNRITVVKDVLEENLRNADYLDYL